MKIFGSRARFTKSKKRYRWVLFSYKGKSVQSKREYEESIKKAYNEKNTAKVIDYTAFLSWYNEHKAAENAQDEYNLPYGYSQKQKRLKFIV